MKPNRIILIRHGESQGNENREIYATIPDYALELTEKGIEQAAEAGRKLKEIIGDESVFFYISPLWRTRMTFEEIANAFNLRPVSLPRRASYPRTGMGAPAQS